MDLPISLNESQGHQDCLLLSQPPQLLVRLSSICPLPLLPSPPCCRSQYLLLLLLQQCLPMRSQSISLICWVGVLNLASVPRNRPDTLSSNHAERAGIIFGDPITGSSTPSWKRLPEMLAAKRMALVGYPAACLPKVQGDRVIGSYKPKHWNEQAREELMTTLVNGSLRIGKISRGASLQICASIFKSNT